MPNRIVRLFLQEAGRRYDLNRGLTPYSAMTDDLKERFGNACAYCGVPFSEVSLVEEHLVPINRSSAGLHSWGNIVPACRECNRLKADHPWDRHPRLNEARRAVIRDYIDEFHYAPNVKELLNVLDKLYGLSDQQTRGLVEFALWASRPYIDGLGQSQRRTSSTVVLTND